MNFDLVELIQSLGEVVYLDFPHQDLTRRILDRPTGFSEIVGFDPADPAKFYDYREQFYLDSFTIRVKFPKGQTTSDSAEYLNTKLTNKNIFYSTRTTNTQYDFPTVSTRLDYCILIYI